MRVDKEVFVVISHAGERLLSISDVGGRYFVFQAPAVLDLTPGELEKYASLILQSVVPANHPPESP